MKVIAAYLLAHLGGKTNPSGDDISKILSSVGVESDAAAVSKLLGELEGKDVTEVIAAGREKLASVPAGGAVAASGGGGGGDASAAGGAAPAVEEKVEEEEDADMGFSLFD